MAEIITMTEEPLSDQNPAWETRNAEGKIHQFERKSDVKAALKRGEILLSCEIKQVRNKNWQRARDVFRDDWDLLLIYDPIDAMTTLFGGIFGFLAFAWYGSIKLAPTLQALGAGAVASYLWSIAFIILFFTIIGLIITLVGFNFVYKLHFEFPYWSMLKSVLWGILAGILGILAGIFVGAIVGSFIKPKVVDPTIKTTLGGKLKKMWKETE